MNNLNLSASFRMATKDDAHLPAYDNTRLQAVNTCPTWGVLRYGMHKQMQQPGRALALECGHAMHEVFSWVRLCTLHRQMYANNQFTAFTAVMHHGQRLFGLGRLTNILAEAKFDSESAMDVKNGAIAVLNTSGYYDDPRDKRRTLTNMEESALVYIDRWRWDQPVWVRDPTDPTSDVGIEIPFDLVVDMSTRSFRLTGRIDGIHEHFDGLRLHENKTAARLNDAWQMSFNMSTQITGYCLAASVFSRRNITRADVIGLSIPMPRTYEYGGYLRDTYNRHDYHFERWLQWLEHTIALDQSYTDNPYDAPRYTHSCSRYFRPCSFIPFCDASTEEQHSIVAEMVHDVWSPLDNRTEDVEPD